MHRPITMIGSVIIDIYINKAVIKCHMLDLLTIYKCCLKSDLYIAMEEKPAGELYIRSHNAWIYVSFITLSDKVL